MLVASDHGFMLSRLQTRLERHRSFVFDNADIEEPSNVVDEARVDKNGFLDCVFLVQASK